MPVSEGGRLLLLPYFRVDERGYFQFKNLLETGEVVFALPAAVIATRPTVFVQMTEIGTMLLGQTVLVDETGQHTINPVSNPQFNELTETGLHIIASFAPFVDYFRQAKAQPASQTDNAPGTGWEIVLYPEDKDSDTFIVLSP